MKRTAAVNVPANIFHPCTEWICNVQLMSRKQTDVHHKQEQQWKNLHGFYEDWTFDVDPAWWDHIVGKGLLFVELFSIKEDEDVDMPQEPKPFEFFLVSLGQLWNTLLPIPIMSSIASLPDSWKCLTVKKRGLRKNHICYLGLICTLLKSASPPGQKDGRL